MVAQLSSSDVSMLSVILSLRKVQLDIAETLAVCTYIADSISPPENTCRQYRTLENFIEGFQDKLSSSSLSRFCEELQLKNVDSLLDLFDAAKCAFHQDSQFVPNAAIVPSMVKRDSLVGLYIRTLCTKWNMLSFSSVGELFDQYSRFCNHDTSSLHSFLHEKAPTVGIGSVGTIDAAENAIQNNDTFTALNHIHRFFDDLDTKAVTSPSQVFRQQEAMLSLATMWIRNEQFSQATIATEEGMRMAHQLGDHASVARALLLLHHLVDRLPEREMGSSLKSPSAESVLIRCAQRCTELGLRALEAQAILLLVRLRCQGPLQTTQMKLQLCGGITSAEEEHDQFRSSTKAQRSDCKGPCRSKIPPNALWTMISSTLLTTPLRSLNNGLSDADCLNFCDIPSSMELTGHAGLVAAELWSRLGIYSMCELSCKRTLRHGGVFLPSELVALLSCILGEVRSKSDHNCSIVTLSHILLLFNSAKCERDVALRTMAGRRCKQAECLLQLAKSIHCSSTSVVKTLKTSLWLVKVRECLYSLDVDEVKLKAVLQLSHTAVLMQSEISQKHSLYFEALILRCIILSLFSKELFLQALSTLEVEAAGLCVWLSEAKILKAIALCSLESGNISKGLSTLQESLEYSKQTYTPLCDASLSVFADKCTWLKRAFY